MRKLFILAFIILSINATPAYALRCGSALVSTGERKIEVLAKCGDPSNIDRRTEYLIIGVGPPGLINTPPVGQAYLPVEIEEWTYNFGPHEFMQLLRFENGVLKEIRSLNWGY